MIIYIHPILSKINSVNMSSKKKIALVTGGNMGLGFETCRQLLELGLTNILTARGLNKGEKAAKQLSDRED
jgi:NAD(P)-dependent dehydrogenase (short-subunit alcohol dehydrogenase family)